MILCLELSQLRRSVGLGCEVAFKFQPLLRSKGAKDVGAVPFREVVVQPGFTVPGGICSWPAMSPMVWPR